MDFLQNLPWWAYLIAGFAVVYYIFFLFYMNKRRGKKNAFREAHPQAASVYAEHSIKGIKSVQVTILEIDGAAYTKYYPEGMRQVYLLLPGKHIFKVSAFTKRPGVMYRKVVETIGPEEIEGDIQSEGKYSIGFNPGTREFTLREID